MRVPLNWLRSYLPALDIEDQSIPEIMARLTAAGIETDSVIELDDGEKAIDLDLTPNRSDCLSMRGVATEIAALFELPLRFEPVPKLQLKVKPEKIRIEAESACSHYLALIIEDVKVGDSPEWVQRRLQAAGMRPINNVVDIANLVMLEIGEPLHTFDLDKLAEERIIVRQASANEMIQTLDSQERRLSAGTLLICDATKPIAIAGVMGDAHTEVTATTTRLLVEAACFERRTIRRTSKEQGLSSEAALRFEKGIDPASLQDALERYAQLAADLSIGSPQQEIISALPYNPERTRSITLRRDRLWLISGLKPSDTETETVLHRLGFSSIRDEQGWQVIVPTFRQDLQMEVDLIEEVARIIGFAELEARMPEGSTTLAVYTPEQQGLRLIRQTLIQCGLTEIVNYSFLDANSKPHLWLAQHGLEQLLIPLQNPLSATYGSLRTMLLPGMLQTLLNNLNQQNNNLQLFEIGSVYIPYELPLVRQPKENKRLLAAFTGFDQLPGWNYKPQEMDFYSAKAVWEQLSRLLHLDMNLQPLQDDPLFHPYRAARVMLGETTVGRIGELHPDLLRFCAIDKRVTILDLDLDQLIAGSSLLPQVEPVPRYPSALRDLALLVPLDLPAAEVLQLIRDCGGTLLEQVRLFDDYRGAQVQQGMKSLAFSLTYRSSAGTLTDQEVNTVHQQIVDQVGEKLGARRRE